MKKMKKVSVCMVVTMLVGVCLAGSSAMKAGAKTKISKTKATICTGETLPLKLSGKTGTVKWKSSKKSIAVVDGNGVVTAKKKGKCVIKARYAGKEFDCMYVKALAHGNFTFKSTFDVSNKGLKIKKYTMTETIK